MFWIFTRIFYTLLYNVTIRWQKLVLEALEKVVFKFSNKDILYYIMFKDKTNNSLGMPPLLYYLSIISITLISILLISNLVIAFVSTDAETKKQRIIESFKNSLKGTVLIISVPILFFIFLLVFGVFQDLLTNGVNSYFDKKNNSFTQMIHDLGWVDDGKQGTPAWDDLGKGYNPIITVFGFVFLAINLFRIAKQVISATLELLLYYFMGPFVAAKMGHDFGKSFNSWRDKVINKFILILGIIFVASITISTINVLSDAILNGLINSFIGDAMQKAIIRLIIIVVGLFFITTANETFISILGESDGSEKKSIIKENLQKEFNKMSNGKKESVNKSGQYMPNMPFNSSGKMPWAPEPSNNLAVNALNKLPPISSNPIKSQVSNAVMKTITQPNSKNNDKFQKSLSKK